MVTLNFHSSCGGQKEYERECIGHFAQFYLPRCFPDMKEVDIQSPEHMHKGEQRKRPDFFLVPPGIVVEVKRVVDEKGRGNIASIIPNIDRLREEVLSRDLNCLRDRYLVRVQFGLRLRDRNVPKVVDKILSAIKCCKPTVDRDTLIDIPGRQQVVIRKSSRKDGSPIVFQPATQHILPVGIICRSIGRVLKKGNEQLRNFEGEARTRVVLLVDDYSYSNETAYAGVARNLYDRILASCNNIDEIWLQVWNPSWEHYLFFSRDCTREEVEHIWREMAKKYLSEITSRDTEGQNGQ